MASPNCEAAITHATNTGNALLKFISANDVNATGAHQWGFYLPKQTGVWQMFTASPPTKGTLAKEPVEIRWQIEEFQTQSVITWYGRGTRSEYRLTRFGRGFPYLTRDSVGDLLVLIPEGQRKFRAFLLDREEDVEDLQAALGLQITESWAVYKDGAPQEESEDACVERRFRGFVQELADFPSGDVFSTETQRALETCIKKFADMDIDSCIAKLMEAEYRLFRLAERALCTSEVHRLFRDIDDFLKTAATIMNRRKSRAGRSLENHVSSLLRRMRIPHEMRPESIEGRPDIVIPCADAYHNRDSQGEDVFVVGVKTTCKDRWRQVLNEARGVRRKYIFTIQPGISEPQLREMHEANISLIVPRHLHKEYPKEPPIMLLTFEDFASHVRAALDS